MRVLGLDLGGANVKAALISASNGQVKLHAIRRYLPIWKIGKERYGRSVEEVVQNLAPFDELAVTMTAELSDVFQSKREGVNFILDVIANTCEHFHVLDVKANLITPEEARNGPLNVASANWAATGWLAGKLFPEDRVLAVDVGSTTTSIIPVDRGSIVAEGLNDIEKLAYGELVYTGVLRTNIAAIVDKVPVKGILTRISAEFFASSGDVHLVLGNIKQEDYSVETANGRGVSVEEAMARLARAVCGDLELLCREDVISIARYVYERQLLQVEEAILQVLSRLKWRSAKVLTLGLGSKFIAREAALKAGLREVSSLEDMVCRGASSTGPAFALACMLLEKRSVSVSRDFLLSLRED
ncbi:MAG: H4MPT-linked C1 transfer pathway protein [Candidatus Methanomethylicota archaeon]|uniref:H4MPT-linked C1 transfer pathway protein n=2 Tax=Thermoproteota archaeon TaxID=2056631 RepID=A0A497ESJ1_9CREN|nr:MAG: H4MPT-linked C1 transfer pathway protein [Candidatus Verstraetearchaeota archaeon]